MFTWHWGGPQEKATISLAIFFSFMRTASSIAISSNGFIECLTPSVMTPDLSGLTRICIVKKSNNTSRQSESRKANFYLNGIINNTFTTDQDTKRHFNYNISMFEKVSHETREIKKLKQKTDLLSECCHLTRLLKQGCTIRLRKNLETIKKIQLFRLK